MATFVLVHGGWHGGWCWKKVVPLLRAAGHDALAPTLTGLGERAHLLTPTVDLETHIRDVAGVLTYEDLERVVLVGHSYGGMVITGVADRCAERVAHLIYLDAFVPGDGQCLIDLLPPARAAFFRERAEVEGDGWRVPAVPVENFGVTGEADLAWAAPKVGPHPMATFTQPVRCREAVLASLPRTYVRCTAFPNDGFDNAATKVRAASGWQYRELPAGHDAMITVPEDLAVLLLDAVAREQPADP
jgi:pimeloyl-ACP methyl ester carboxylesterase